MNTFKLRITTPSEDCYDADAYQLSVRVTDGDIAIMAGHIPFVTSVVKGQCAVWLDEDTKKSAVTEGGLLTVGADSVTFLSGSFRFDEQ